jgi:hypothetical protein
MSCTRLIPALSSMVSLSRRSDTDSPDRFGDTHWDFRTVEYGLGPKPEEGAMWQFTRGSECSKHHPFLADRNQSGCLSATTKLKQHTTG